MTSKAELLRAALAATANNAKTEERTPSTGDNASYPFWNMNTGSSVTVRFLDDADVNNPFFWVRREVIKLVFDGVVGGDYPTQNEVTVTVPCVDMFGMACPIIAATRPLWKTNEELARKYYKKKSYIFQGFIVGDSPIAEQNVPANPIRRWVINPTIYGAIESALQNPELEDLPTDPVGGRDFKITKTQNGQWADYKTSQWSFKTRSLSAAEHEAIDTHGLFNLKDFLGPVPDSDTVDAIKAMFEDSIEGKPFDYDSFGKYYRPYTGRGNDDATPVARASTPSAKSAPKASVAEKVVEAAETPKAEGRPSPQDILERIKNRSANR